ncbi:MAG TPA: aminotransferase class V-fold PLP-dependent enzyme [Pontiella sp.]
MSHVINSHIRLHRDQSFLENFSAVREGLCALVSAGYVEIMMGPSILANDIIAGQLALLGRPGLVLVSGEFGQRLVRNANGAKLFFHTLEISAGESFRRDTIEKVLNAHSEIEWIWGMHCETSTGVLNDVEMYKKICAERNLKLCLDCISSIGSVPLNLSGVYLASWASGNGLASPAGLAVVFHDHELEPAPDDLPCVLDLGLYHQHKHGVPFSLEPHLIQTLLVALTGHDLAQRYEEICSWSKTFRRKLTEIDAAILAPDSCAMPAIITIALPDVHSSEVIGKKLKNYGMSVGYRSSYLRERNWIQARISTSEYFTPERFVNLLREELVR